MNKEILTENLNEILESVKTVIHTANAELPAILDEIVRWGVIKYSAFSLISFGCMLFFVVFAILCIKDDFEDDAFFLAGFASLISLLGFVYNLIRLLFAYTAPKLYIIDYLKDLIQ